MMPPPDYFASRPLVSAARRETAFAPPEPRNDLARAYQPRRVWASAVCIAWNLLFAGLFVGSGSAVRLCEQLSPGGAASTTGWWVGPLYFIILFAGYAALNLPLELWFGYLQERQFGLAKDGVRAWARDWAAGNAQHGVMFVAGSCLLYYAQVLWPGGWLAAAAAILLLLFLTTTWLAADLIPIGLFHLQSADDPTTARLARLLRIGPGAPAAALPPIVIYSHSGMREFAGGIIGLRNRQVMLISRAALEQGSDVMLRFVLLHDLGHRRYHHNLLSTLAGWAWVVLGLVVSGLVIPDYLRDGTHLAGSPAYIAFLAVTISIWMVVGEPVLAYLGRRLEYQADRAYLRWGGTLEEMQTALDELAHQNLARTEAMRRRDTIFHPLPSISNRLHRARKFKGQSPTHGAD